VPRGCVMGVISTEAWLGLLGFFFLGLFKIWLALSCVEAERQRNL
jgi:hypothetical protein